MSMMSPPPSMQMGGRITLGLCTRDERDKARPGFPGENHAPLPCMKNGVIIKT